MTRDEVAWCRQKVTQRDEDVSVWGSEVRRQQDFFGEIAAAWQDTAARRVLRTYLEPFLQNCADELNRLTRQTAELNEAVKNLSDSVDPTQEAWELSERSQTLRSQVGRFTQTARAAAHQANSLASEADSMAAEACHLLNSL